MKDKSSFEKNSFKKIETLIYILSKLYLNEEKVHGLCLQFDSLINNLLVGLIMSKKLPFL